MARDDRILLSTRLLAAVIIPFLLLAFLILYLTPGDAGRRFAWDVAPRTMAMYVGAGYLGGAYLFTHALLGRRWHRVATGFPPVATFATSMLLITIIHWDSSYLRHFPFQLWLILYVVTPVLVPLAYAHNRRFASMEPEMRDASVPEAARWGLGVLGGVLLAFAVVAFVWPSPVVRLWPWALSDLTARMLGGWCALLGVGGVVIARERRWSAWRVGLESIALWHALVLLAALLNRQDFVSLANWYVIGVGLVLLGMVALYVAMERRRRESSTDSAAGAAPAPDTP